MAWKPQLKRILFIVSEDWYFVSHRLHLAVEAQRAGFQVGLLTNVSSHGREIEDAGIALFEWNLNRRSRNLFLELGAISKVLSTLRRFKPDLIHAVALKPVLYSSIASRVLGLRRRVFAMGGLGYVFSGRKLARFTRPLFVGLLRLALAGRATRLILQNTHDRALLAAARAIEPDRVRLIRGAGVDTDAFFPQPDGEGAPVIILPARMLWDKGVADFVACAIKLRERGLSTRFALVGDPDRHNPECVPESQLLAWQRSGVIEWWGRRADMPNVYAQAHIVCLPSVYGEGLPKVLLEAASCGRPIVTYDIPGCREIVEHGVNGFLVSPRNIEQLCEAVASLVANPELRRTMGAEGRKKVTEFFSQEMIAAQTRAVWDEILGDPPNSASLTNPAT